MATVTLPYKPLTFLLFSLLACSANGQLSTTFYQKTCPNLLTIVRSGMTQAIAKDARMGGSLLRLFFHDCFVNGCDAGVLLDDTANFTGEKNAGPNANSLRGFEVIDSIKTQIEASCKATVSCADILALTARDSVNLLRGPFWDVPLGRRDARTASMSGANANLPGPGSSLSTLISMFAAQGLTANEMTVLSGAHTIGQARCTFFRNRIYNEKNINASFASIRQQTCPQSGGDNNLAPFDVQTPNQFDNWYFANLVKNKGLLHSDQELFNGGSQDSLVQQYSTNMALFAADFAKAMIKLGNINVLTGNKGEIRLNCRKTN